MRLVALLLVPCLLAEPALASFQNILVFYQWEKARVKGAVVSPFYDEQALASETVSGAGSLKPKIAEEVLAAAAHAGAYVQDARPGLPLEEPKTFKIQVFPFSDSSDQTAWDRQIQTLDQEFGSLADPRLLDDILSKKDVELFDAFERLAGSLHIKLPKGILYASFIVTNPIGMKALRYLVEAIDQKPEMVTALLNKVFQEDRLLWDSWTSLRFHESGLSFHPTWVWEQWRGFHLSLKEQVHCTLRTITLEENGFSATGWPQILVKITQISKEQRHQWLAKVEELNQSYRRLVTWSLMHELPYVRAIVAYRGVARKNLYPSKFNLVDPEHSSFSKRDLEGYAYPDGEIISAVVPLDAIIGIDDHGLEQAIVKEGSYERYSRKVHGTTKARNVIDVMPSIEPAIPAESKPAHRPTNAEQASAGAA